MKYQTDYMGYIKDHGCLVCSIVTAVEEIVGSSFSTFRFLELLEYLNERGVISDEDDNKKPGAFVHNHPGVFNEAFRRLGSDHKVKYTGRIYMPWEEAKGKKSFGKRKGDIIILHIQTPNTGHFRLPDFDPYRPGTKMIDLKSLRFYTLK